jgi:beta-lactamase class C
MADALADKGVLTAQMRVKLKYLIALAALGVAGWYGVHHLTGDGKLPAIVGMNGDGLPDSPEEWHGKIDYRTLDRQLAELATRPEMAGLAVAIIEDGELRFVGTYGVADRATGARVTPQTVFRWASVSKTATGALAAALAQEGRLDLGRPLADWATTLRLPGGAEARVTVAQLLSQRTGLTKNAYDEKLEAGDDPAAIRAQLVNAPLQCAPGSCHTYQNVAFDAASEILAEAAGQPMPAMVEQRFFRPLGMASAGYGMAGLTGAKNWARPHKNEAVLPVKPAYWRVPAAAGVESDIGDFARWMQAMMGLRPDILPKPALRLAATPLVETPSLYSGDLAKALSDTGYGLGLRSFSYEGQRLLGHSGAVDGYRATMIYDSEGRIGVVALWNSNWGIPFRIPFAVFDSYHKRPDCGWLDVSMLPLPDAPPPMPPPPPKPETEEVSPCLTR